MVKNKQQKLAARNAAGPDGKYTSALRSIRGETPSVLGPIPDGIDWENIGMGDSGPWEPGKTWARNDQDATLTAVLRGGIEAVPVGAVGDDSRAWMGAIEDNDADRRGLVLVVRSLALRYSPNRVQILTVTNTPEMCEAVTSLPHSVGMLDSDNDGYVRAVLEAEMARREGLLRQYGCASWQELRERSLPDVEVPDLVIVVAHREHAGPGGERMSLPSSIRIVRGKDQHLLGIHLLFSSEAKEQRTLFATVSSWAMKVGVDGATRLTVDPVGERSQIVDEHFDLHDAGDNDWNSLREWMEEARPTKPGLASQVWAHHVDYVLPARIAELPVDAESQQQVEALFKQAVRAGTAGSTHLFSPEILVDNFQGPAVSRLSGLIHDLVALAPAHQYQRSRSRGEPVQSPRLLPRQVTAGLRSLEDELPPWIPRLSMNPVISDKLLADLTDRLRERGLAVPPVAAMALVGGLRDLGAVKVLKVGPATLVDAIANSAWHRITAVDSEDLAISESDIAETLKYLRSVSS